MRQFLIPLLALSALATIQQGCAPAVVVGGAAATASIVHDRRTAGTILEDQAIELKALDLIRKDPELGKQAHINVTSYNMIVLLSGETPTEAMRARAEQIVRGIEKVRRVYNELTVAAPSSMMTRSSDSLITAQVKTALFGTRDLPGFNPNHVKVVTENGTVYLMGLVRRAEGNAAAEAARQVKGVQRVVKLFEYID